MAQTETDTMHICMDSQDTQLMLTLDIGNYLATIDL